MAMRLIIEKTGKCVSPIILLAYNSNAVIKHNYQLVSKPSILGKQIKLTGDGIGLLLQGSMMTLFRCGWQNSYSVLTYYKFHQDWILLKKLKLVHFWLICSKLQGSHFKKTQCIVQITVKAWSPVNTLSLIHTHYNIYQVIGVRKAWNGWCITVYNTTDEHSRSECTRCSQWW